MPDAFDVNVRATNGRKVTVSVNESTAISEIKRTVGENLEGEAMSKDRWNKLMLYHHPHARFGKPSQVRGPCNI